MLAKLRSYHFPKHVPIHRILDALLALLLTVSLTLMAVANEEAFARDGLCKYLNICFTSANPKFWNKIVYDIATGTVLSVIFYALLVKVPEGIKRRRMRRGLERRYLTFKRSCLAVIGLVVDGSYNSESLESLLDKATFRQHFQRDPETKVSKWDAFLNNVAEENIREILIHVELLREEITYVVNNTDIENDDALEFLKGLGSHAHWLRDSSPSYDGVTRLSGFLWSALSGWNGPNGYQQPDVIEAIISKI
jgi:hypothetical protein